MSYQVLARKWRPRTFHELVGQEHVQRALVNALDQGRLHHAYLFTGTRGVGKTTLARILAKCLNCTAGGQGDEGVTSRPCGACESCRAIDDGRFVDLIEVDAASRTKVEDTRELLDNVQYAPTQGRYKVYLIDEVHMLSTHSFNALLKTLEEPPPHVKFLLATTDPQKLPVTVLSRCLQFTLKNMPPERIVEHLSRVLNAEEVTFEESALWLLGKAADGSMRDAMSLTDQAIAFGQGTVRHEDVAAMLGTLDHRHLLALVDALAEVDAARVLEEIAALAEQGPDFTAVLDDLLGLLHRLAIAQMVPDAVDNGHGDRDSLLALATRFTAEDVQLYYQIGLQGRGDMEYSPDMRAALEMTLLRMLAFRPQGVPKPAETPLPLRGESKAVSSTPSDSSEDALSQDETAPSMAVPPTADETPPSTAAPPTTDETAPSNEAAPVAALAASSGEVSSPVDSSLTAKDFQTAKGLQSAEDFPLGEDASSAGGSLPNSGSLSTEDSASSLDEPPWLVDERLAPQASAPTAARTHEEGHADESAAEHKTPASEKAVPRGEERLDHSLWLALFEDLALSGLTRNLAAHCAVEADNGTTLTLRLDPGQAAMLADIHIERMQKALAVKNIVRRLDVTPGEIAPTIETPSAQAERLARERHAVAVEALRSDPHIQQLQQVFGARLIEESVSPESSKSDGV